MLGWANSFIAPFPGGKSEYMRDSLSFFFLYQKEEDRLRLARKKYNNIERRELATCS